VSMPGGVKGVFYAQWVSDVMQCVGGTYYSTARQQTKHFSARTATHSVPNHLFY
jgi:hypothetical protein